MDRYMKAFVIMSMVYLLVGSALGVILAIEPPSPQLRFGHVHFNLLGFMAMMIFGVGYFILPRFSGRVLRWPKLVGVHFWSSNLSLLGMVLLYGIWTPGWLASICIQTLSGALFLANVGLSVLWPEEREVPSTRAPERVLLGPTTKVAEILEKYPQVRQVLVDQGVKALSDPGHVEHVKKLGVTFAMMARRHGLDEAKLLETVASSIGAEVELAPACPARIEGPIGKDSVIGDVIKAYPHTEAVFRKFYGEGCFSCPGQAFETIAQSALMHNVDLGEILSELNKAAKSS